MNGGQFESARNVYIDCRQNSRSIYSDKTYSTFLPLKCVCEIAL